MERNYWYYLPNIESELPIDPEFLFNMPGRFSKRFIRYVGEREKAHWDNIFDVWDIQVRRIFKKEFEASSTGVRK